MSIFWPRNRFIAAAVIASFVAIGASQAAAQPGLQLTSPAFADGAAVPADFTCTGADRSPRLAWTGAPAATKSFALIVEDPDAPMGTFIHWVVYDLPPATSALGEGVPKIAHLPQGGMQGVNSFGRVGYNGPCPPAGKVHHYHFRLYALDSAFDPGAGSDAAAVEEAMRGHVIASTDLVGTFSR
ncbi:MAG TPA: YbhB/YbcL family Raf kinase inhibitor-like protein [Candidatus Binataceae bacterium]|nr:YbhB/YbcL family Raf kinase inhibitor-like protein [Candidatus Binataceae bacterium]